MQDWLRSAMTEEGVHTFARKKRQGTELCGKRADTDSQKYVPPGPQNVFGVRVCGAVEPEHRCLRTSAKHILEARTPG